MKRIGTALTIVFIIAGFAISFFIGHYVSDKSHTESRAAQFDKYISRAIDTIKDKGLSIDGAPEAIASNIWVAHEFCDSPEISAELSNLWNTIVYEKDVLLGQEDVLTAQLKDILEKCPDISETTVQRALADLLKKHKIIKISGGRYTSYTWNREDK